MPLPDLIEIIPLNAPLRAQVTVPGSKSITNRALILAALAEGETVLQGALWSEDTQVMVNALKKLGFGVKVEPDPEEFCNRTILVNGQGGKIPEAGTADVPLEIFVGNAGTVARFLAPLVCLGHGFYKLHGVPRMHERPQAALFQALRQLGYQVDSPNNKLPAVIRGSGPRPGRCKVDIQESSQFASGLILCSTKGGWHIELTFEPQGEPPYVNMTSKLLAIFPGRGGSFQIEPDASSGSYFWAADRLVPGPELRYVERLEVSLPTQPHGAISVAHWPTSSWQIDEHFPAVVRRSAALHYGLEFHQNQAHRPEMKKDYLNMFDSPAISRETDLGDSIMTAIVLAPFGLEPTRFTDLGRMRVQESERVVALRVELEKCGGKVIETGDTLEVVPSELHGAEIETYDDHRMAMCFAILGLKVPGIKIKNPSCVKKTFPNFFQKLAGSPPYGLGARIMNGATETILENDQLFPD